MIEYIRKHWRGGLSLPVSYWVNSWLANFVVVVFTLAINASTEGSINPVSILAALLAVYGLVFAVVVWQVVGTWRSAQNHKTRTGRKGWAVAAQVMIVLGLFQAVKIFSDGTQQIVEMVQIVTESDDLSTYTVEVRDGDLYFEGYITFGLAEELEKMLGKGEIKTVHLNSEGGRIGPARHIANLILDRNADTYSEYGCYSACTSMFIAGQTRVLNVGAELGFHSGAMPGVSDRDMRIAQQEDVEFFVSRKIPRAFVEKSLRVPNSDVWFPTYQELMDANVVTHIRVADRNIAIREFCRKQDCRERSTAPQRLQEISARINLDLPRRIDAITTLERTVSGPENRMTYSYSVLSHQRVDFALLGRNVTEFACSDPEIRTTFFDYSTTVQWEYRDQSGSPLFEVELSQDSCEPHHSSVSRQ